MTLLVQLGLEQSTQVGRTRRSAGIRHTLDGFSRLSGIESLDGQLNRTRLAIDVENHGFDVVAYVQRSTVMC